MKLAVLALIFVASAQADESRRLFDFTPVSANNPVVATINETIKIPLSELRAYRDAERLNTITDPASLPQKRAVMDDLISEYLYVDEAFRTGVDRSPGFVNQMKATHTMVLTDFIASRVESEKSTEHPEPGDATLALAHQLFEAADIRISNEAYALLKKSAAALDQSRAAANLGPVIPTTAAANAQLHAIINDTPEAVLARYEDKSISVRQILAIYAGLPDSRPNLHMTEGLLEMLKPLIVPELMAIEAARKGLADDPVFKNKLMQNRNALLRFSMQDLIDHEVNAAMRAPNHDAEMRAWHAKHRANYGPPRETPGQPAPAYEEIRAVVEGDYSVMLREKFLAEKARALRKTRTIEVDDAVLAKL
ncbi:hypothetical protein [Oleiharenicola lentus]|uniref:hypothetical protein n=1 Tax=Oleiharenicola lentus TaxID=2508720 RepID=UPI003F6764B0